MSIRQGVCRTAVSFPDAKSLASHPFVHLPTILLYVVQIEACPALHFLFSVIIVCEMVCVAVIHSFSCLVSQSSFNFLKQFVIMRL
jgi:hypothetical protein